MKAEHHLSVRVKLLIPIIFMTENGLNPAGFSTTSRHDNPTLPCLTATTDTMAMREDRG